MKLSLDLTTAGYTAAVLETGSAVTLDNGKITRPELTLHARIPGITEEEFQQIAHNAEQTCPVSQAFNFEIILNATLLQ